MSTHGSDLIDILLLFRSIFSILSANIKIFVFGSNLALPHILSRYCTTGSLNKKNTNHSSSYALAIVGMVE